jgi:hypothetical protein
MYTLSRNSNNCQVPGNLGILYHSTLYKYRTFDNQGKFIYVVERNASSFL